MGVHDCRLGLRSNGALFLLQVLGRALDSQGWFPLEAADILGVVFVGAGGGPATGEDFEGGLVFEGA